MYLQLIVIILSLTFASCASGDWKIKDVAPIKREWRQCDARLDKEKAGKGFCYISQECKVFLFEKCRPLPLFCPWGDLDCLKKNEMDNMVLKTKENL